MEEIKSVFRNGIKGFADSTFEGLLQSEIDSGKSRVDALRAVLIQAVSARYGSNGKAMKHMKHFIGGTGNFLEVSLEDLIREDTGVRTRLNGELLRRANGITTLKESYEASIMSRQIIDTRITLFQKTFAVEDWAGALGSFDIIWEIIACPARKSSPLTVALSGKNIYKWHPDDNRITQKLHEYASELVDLGGAKEFEMRTGISVFQFSQIDNCVIEGSFFTQTNPNNNSLKEFLLGAQPELAAKGATYQFFGKHIHMAKKSLNQLMIQAENMIR